MEQSTETSTRTVWWISDGPLSRGARRLLGPFESRELAIEVRSYVERADKRSDLWVDDCEVPA